MKDRLGSFTTGPKDSIGRLEVSRGVETLGRRYRQYFLRQKITVFLPFLASTSTGRHRNRSEIRKSQSTQTIWCGIGKEIYSLRKCRPVRRMRSRSSECSRTRHITRLPT